MPNMKRRRNLADLTEGGAPESAQENFRKIKEWERFAPKTVLREGGDETISVSTTTTTPETITPASPPKGAVGVVAYFSSDRTTGSCSFEWRTDANDTWRVVQNRVGGQESITQNYYFSPDSMSFQVRWSTTVSGGTGATLYIKEWIF